MSPHQIIALFVRLFAIWIVVSVARYLPAFYLQGSKLEDPYALPITLAVLFILAIIVLLLWFFPKTIARGLLKNPTSEEVSPVSHDTWLAIGSGLIGLWLLASALPGLISALLAEFILSNTDVYSSQVRTWLLYNGAQILISIWLIFGARGFRKVFWWARNAGRY